MKIKKRLDVFNFFYSIGAVLILVGIMAKILDFANQEYLIAAGLLSEIVIFFLSAFTFNEIQEEKTTDNGDLDLTKVVNVDMTNAALISTDSNSVFPDKSSQQAENKPVSITPVLNSNPIEKDNTKENLFNNYLNTSEKFGNQNVLSDSIQAKSKLDYSELSSPKIGHIEWILFSDDEYDVLQLVFNKLFQTEITSKSSLTKWKLTSTQNQIVNLEELIVNYPIFLTKNEIKILYKAYNLIGLDYVLKDKYIFFKVDYAVGIRNKEKNEISIFINDNELLEKFVLTYFDPKFVIAPNIACLNELTNFKGDLIYEYAISNSNLKDFKVVEELTHLLRNQSNELKLKFWLQLETIIYDVQTRMGFDKLKILVPFLLSFSNTRNGYQLLNKILILKLNDGKLVKLSNTLFHQSIGANIYLKNMEMVLDANEHIKMIKNNDNVNEVFILVKNLFEFGIRPVDGLLEIFGLCDKTNSYDNHIKNISEILLENNVNINTDNLLFIHN